MELSKLLELYADLYHNRGSIGWNYQDSAILDHVREQIYSRVTANEACQAGAVSVPTQTAWSNVPFIGKSNLR